MLPPESGVGVSHGRVQGLGEDAAHHSGSGRPRALPKRQVKAMQGFLELAMSNLEPGGLLPADV